MAMAAVTRARDRAPASIVSTLESVTTQ